MVEYNGSDLEVVCNDTMLDREFGAGTYQRVIARTVGVRV